MSTSFEPVIVALVNASMPKEVIIMYFANSLPEAQVNTFLRNHHPLKFSEAIPSMLTFYVKGNAHIPNVNISYLKVCVRRLLKMEEIEIAVKYSSLAINRLTKLRYTAGLNKNYKTLIDKINDGDDCALLSKPNYFDKFVNVVRNNSMDLSGVDLGKWPASFILHLIEKSDDDLLTLRKRIEKGDEAKIDRIISLELSNRDISIINQSFGLKNHPVMSLTDVALESKTSVGVILDFQNDALSILRVRFNHYY